MPFPAVVFKHMKKESLIYKEENIVVYLLYMWRLEDTLRAFQFDVERILTVLCLEDETQEEERIFLQELIDMMLAEGVKESGHLQVNKNLVSWLTELHNKLLASHKIQKYNALYYQVLPTIVELRAKSQKTEISEIETCLEAMYGYSLLEMQGKPVSQVTTEAMLGVKQLMATLAEVYKQEKAGTFPLENI